MHFDIRLNAYNSGSQPVDLDPFWGVEQLFHMGPLRPLENTDIYIPIHSSGKITVMT